MEFDNFILKKIIIAVSSFVGVGTVSVFWLPKGLRGYSPLRVGVSLGAAGVGLPQIVVPFAMQWFGASTDIETLVFFSGVAGIMSVPVVVWLTNYFDRSSDKTIFEVAKEVRAGEEKDGQK